MQEGWSLFLQARCGAIAAMEPLQARKAMLQKETRRGQVACCRKTLCSLSPQSRGPWMRRQRQGGMLLGRSQPPVARQGVKANHASHGQQAQWGPWAANELRKEQLWMFVPCAFSPPSNFTLMCVAVV
eukprot:1156835-Pelagomonas_calceolata.AAC.3